MERSVESEACWQSHECALLGAQPQLRSSFQMTAAPLHIVVAAWETLARFPTHRAVRSCSIPLCTASWVICSGATENKHRDPPPAPCPRSSQHHRGQERRQMGLAVRDVSLRGALS